MNAALCAHLVRVMIVACTLGFLCQCSSIDCVVTTDSRRFDEKQLATRIKKLKQGDSMERCVAILGEPNMRRAETTIGLAPRQHVGTIFDYVVRQKGNYLDSGDLYLHIWFEPTDRLESATFYGHDSLGEDWTPQ
jgi:hypothetical protein